MMTETELSVAWQKKLGVEFKSLKKSNISWALCFVA